MVQKKNRLTLENNLMLNGRKETSEKIILNSFKIIQKVSAKETKPIIKTALKNISPILSLTKVKSRKSLKYVPFFLLKYKRITNSIRILASNSKNNKRHIVNSLQNLLLDSAYDKGIIKDKIKELHVNSFINKNFSYYRWFQ